MKLTTIKVTCLIIFLVSIVFCVETEAKKCSVKGKVVDDFGVATSEAELYLGGAYVDDIDSIIVISNPEDSGVFNLERTCSDNLYYLFITSAIDRSTSIVPIEPPFSMFEGKKRDFPSLAGVKMMKQIADVGDIKIQTIYRKVNVKFQNEKQENLFSSSEEATKVIFTVRNEKRKIGGMTTLSKLEAFNNSLISINLPEGKWIIEVELNRGKGKTLYPNKLVEIARNDDNLREITLEMSRKKVKFK